MGSNLEFGVCFRCGCQAHTWMVVRSVERCRDCGYILKLELAEFPGRLVMGCGIKCMERIQHFWPEQLE